MKILAKFCGMMSVEDILAAAQAGVDYLGFVLVPGSRRYLERNTLPALLAVVPKNVKIVFVTADLGLPGIAQLIADFYPDVIQLHGRENADYARAIQGAEVWKAVQLNSDADVAAFSSFPAEFLLADAGQGGSGQCCDWQMAAKMAAQRKIFLAGGITPENVTAALELSHASGIDVASGIEDTPGKKNLQKMQQIISSIRQFEKKIV